MVAVSRTKPNYASPSSKADEMSAADLSKEAERRLAANKNSPCADIIQQLVEQHGLEDEVQLALRMLKPSELKDLCSEESGLQWRLAEVPDANEFLMGLIADVDFAVKGLVQKLMQLDAGANDAENAEYDPSVEASDVADDASTVQAAVEERIFANRHVKIQREQTIVKLRSKYPFGDDVELGLRMLKAAQMNELMAGMPAIAAKLSDGSDPSTLLRWLIAELDPEVDELVGKVQLIDEGGDNTQSEEFVEKEVPAPARTNGAPTNGGAHVRRLQPHPPAGPPPGMHPVSRSVPNIGKPRQASAAPRGSIPMTRYAPRPRPSSSVAVAGGAHLRSRSPPRAGKGAMKPPGGAISSPRPRGTVGIPQPRPRGSVNFPRR